jgi:hypothetical protein
LANAFGSVDLLRLNNHNNKMLYSLLAKEKYDLVIFLVFDGVLMGMYEENLDYEQTRLYLKKP